MSDIILFRPKYVDHDVPIKRVPWGILYTSAFLVKEGYGVRIFDETVNPNWQKSILNETKRNPIFFGVSSMTGKQIEYGLNFSEFVKKHSDAPVVWGGIHPSILPEQTLENENIDFVIKGEGEETAVELAKSLEKKRNLKKIRGLGFKKENRIIINDERPFIELNSVPDIPYNLIDVNQYINKEFGAERMFEICTSRGCPHKCSFCYNLNFNRCTWRSLGIDKIFDNLHRIINKYRVDGINWREDNFFVSKKRVKQISERIIEDKIDIIWHADCKINYFHRYEQEFIDLLKKSGCHTLTFGVESGSNKILKNINKGITREQVIKVKDKLVKNSIYQNYHFMMGFPGETNVDIAQTISLIYKLVNKNRFFGELYGPSLYTPYPGTDLYEESLDNGFKPPDKLGGWIKMDWQGLNVPWFSPKEKEVMKNIILNMGGLRYNKGLLRKYFLFKLYLLAKFNIKIPDFKKKVT